MMVFQCLMVVIESGWQMVRIASPILVALFRATRFSSSFFMNSLKIANGKEFRFPIGFASADIKMKYCSWSCFNTGARQSYFNQMKS